MPDTDPSQLEGMVIVVAEPDSNSSTSLLFKDEDDINNYKDKGSSEYVTPMKQKKYQIT